MNCGRIAHKYFCFFAFFEQFCSFLTSFLKDTVAQSPDYISIRIIAYKYGGANEGNLHLKLKNLPISQVPDIKILIF